MDWTHILLAVISGVPATIAALAAFHKVKALHLEINSRMTELLRRTSESAHAAGVAQEQAAETKRKTK